MSANNPEDEFGVGEDLEALLAETPAPATKAKRPAKIGGRVSDATPTDDRPVHDVELPNSATMPVAVTTTSNAATPAPSALTLDDIRGLFGEMKESLRSELLNEMAEKSPKSLDVPVAVAAAQPVAEPGTGITIHFVDDGFTIGGQVFYRGQEYTAPDGTEWVTMTPRAQFARYGRTFFRQGPWDGAGFDLDDPALTDEDRARLAALSR